MIEPAKDFRSISNPCVKDAARQIPRLEAILNEIEYGDSRTKLYAQMLASEMIRRFSTHCPRHLLLPYAYRLAKLRIPLYEIDKWQSDFEDEDVSSSRNSRK